MPTTFKISTEYYLQSAKGSSDRKQWRGLRLYRARETSNDVIFENTGLHTLTLDLTGTRYHLTRMDGIHRERPTAPGEICCTPAGLEARFAWEVAGAVQTSIVAEFDTTLFSVHCPEIATNAFIDGTLTPDDYRARPAVSAILLLLARELDGNLASGTLFAETALRLLAIEIAATAWSVTGRLPPVGDAGDKRVLRAVDFIAANFRNDVSLLQLCEATGLSTSRLIQLFRKATGRSPYAYLVDQRIKWAVHLIETTDMPLAEIALDAGFADQQHMTHAFRRKLQRSPSSFRRTGFRKDAVDANSSHVE